MPTKEAKDELVEKLSALISSEYEIVDQEVGIRPTVGDRRALLGKHHKYPQLIVFNGLGTRGIMSSAMLAIHLFEHIENDKELLKEVNVNRFGTKKAMH